MTLATNAKRDYYEVLGVERGASDNQLKSAYRKLAMQFHPDRNPDDPKAEEKFKEASEAYAVLADAGKRARYDQFGHAAVNGGGFDASNFQDLGDIFGDLFGFGEMFGGGGRRRTRAARGADIRADITLEFEEAAFGINREVTIQRREECGACEGSGSMPGKSAATCTTCGGRGQLRFQQGFFSVARTCTTCMGTGSVITDPCKKCRGEGRILRESKIEVKIPAGIEDGTRIVFSGDGEAGLHGGPAGDLYVVLRVKEHAFFEREGKDLFCELTVTFPQASLGTEIKVPTLDGEHELKIPAGTQPDTQFKVRNKGLPVVQGSGKGDLYVNIKVETPSKLSKRQRELLEELDQLTTADGQPDRNSILGKVKDIFS